MDDPEKQYDSVRAEKMSELLIQTLGELGKKLIAGKDY